jgi:hypothetical protein
MPWHAPEAIEQHRLDHMRLHASMVYYQQCLERKNPPRQLRLGIDKPQDFLHLSLINKRERERERER